MSLTRINFIKDNLPQEISEIDWIYNDYFYTSKSITLSQIINYKCSFCETQYNNAIAYIYSNILGLNKIYRCLNCLRSNIIWKLVKQGQYERAIFKMVKNVNKSFNSTKFILQYELDKANCSGDKCNDKEIKEYRFKYDNQDKFLCFMCYCDYKDNLSEMSMSKKPRRTPKRSKTKPKRTPKRSNRKAISTGKRSNRKPKSSRKK